MATGVKHYQFIEDLAHKVHDLSSDALTAYLTNTAPVSANALYGDLTAPVSTNLSSRVFGTPTTDGQVNGIYTLLLPDLLLTATGAVADFSYCGIYNDTPTSPLNPLICFWPIGSTISGMDAPNTFLIDSTTSTLTLT